MNIPPTSYITARLLGAFDRIVYGRLSLTMPNGETHHFEGAEPGPNATWQIMDWNVVRRLAMRGDIALGEDYIDGTWHTDSVEQLFRLFLMNYEQLADFANGTVIRRLIYVLSNRVFNRNSRHGSSRNIRAHYDVGNEFYSLWLDETMTYSSALFRNAEEGLAQGQRNKYQRIVDKAGASRDAVLEVGCGWGGFAEHAAQNDLQVTGITISPAQHEFAKRRLNTSADIRLQDYRDVRGDFDMIVSIEMFEAVGERYWPTYFKLLAERLKRSGKAVIQTITIRDELFADYRTCSDFIRHYVFPGGMLPSQKVFKEQAAKAGLACRESFTFGQDYAETLRRWTERFNARRSDILALGHDDAFIRNWQYYLGICAAAFSVGRTDVAQMELVHA